MDREKLIQNYKTYKEELKLKPRYLAIFEFRNGLINGNSHTLKESGNKFGISGNRIYQIEARVKYELKRLSNDKNVKHRAV